MATSFSKDIDFKKLIPCSLAAIIIIALLGLTLKTIFSYYNHQLMQEIFSDPYDMYVIKFDLWQALLSTILTIMLAIPTARALHRRTNFFGRRVIVNILNISLSLPVMVLVVGIIIIHGKHGWVNNFMNFAFNSSFNHYLYGMFGIIIGHLSFCLPLATKLFLNDLENIPVETWRISRQLNFSSLRIFQYIEWPAICKSAAKASFFVYILCFTSFVIILSLGNGPTIVTLETYIYQMISLGFNLEKAAMLSSIQLVICALLLLSCYKLDLQVMLYSHGNRKKINRFESTEFFGINFFKLGIDSFFICLIFVISILPIVAVIYNGLNEKLLPILYSKQFLLSLKQSLTIAACSAILTLVMALSLVSGALYLQHQLKLPFLAKVALWFSNARLLVPGFTLITALCLYINDFSYVMNHAFYFLIIMNIIAALPFATYIIYSHSAIFTIHEINLCRNLNLNYIDFIKLIYYPRIRKSLGFALSFSMAIAWGELGLISLFSSKDLNTLPYLLYTMLSDYNLEEAVMISLVMISFSFFFFWVVEEFWTGENNVRT